MRSAARCISIRQPGTLIRITTGGIQGPRRPWHISRVCSRIPSGPLYWFSDDQIAQGLTYLVGTSASGDNGWLSAIEVPVEARLRCVEAIGKLFDRLFAPRCTPHLSHLSEVAAGRLNCVLYVVGRISMHRIAVRPEPATAKRYSFDDHGAHSGTGFARLPGKCIAWAGALAASTCERGRAHRRRICLVTNGAGSAASRVMWLRIVMHRAEIRSRETDRRTER